MPNYTFSCTECTATKKISLPRNKVPKYLKCECGKPMQRAVRAAQALVQPAMEEPTETQKLRENLKQTDERMKGLEDPTVAEGIKQWRKELTGGRY